MCAILRLQHHKNDTVLECSSWLKPTLDDIRRNIKQHTKIILQILPIIFLSIIDPVNTVTRVKKCRHLRVNTFMHHPWDTMSNQSIVDPHYPVTLVIRSSHILINAFMHQRSSWSDTSKDIRRKRYFCEILKVVFLCIVMNKTTANITLNWAGLI